MGIPASRKGALCRARVPLRPAEHLSTNCKPQVSIMSEPNAQRRMLLMRYGSMVAGPLLCALIYFSMPSTYALADGSIAEFTSAGRACLGVLVWMAIWWCFETIPIAATSMLPMVLFPLFQVTKVSEAMAPYASDTVFLFLGAFLLAGGVMRWGLDRRIALVVMSVIGTTPKKMIFGMMFTTAFLSAFMSNTACAAMMVPVAMALISLVQATTGSVGVGDSQKAKQVHNFTLCILLGLAYCASIGGMATLIGSPPNGIYMRFMEQTYGTPVSITEWMKVGLPVTVLLFIACYFLLTGIMFRDMGGEIPGGKEWVKNELRSMGKLSHGEIAVGVCFFLAAVLWFSGSALRGIELEGGIRPFRYLTDAVIAMGMGAVTFMIPVDAKGTMAMDWKTANEAISWDVLLLFGGGLSLAAAIQHTGVAQLIGSQVVALSGAPFPALLMGVVTIVTFATGVTSNTALAAMMMPLIAAVAAALGVPAQPILIGTALAASSAFILPISTPPNAIVFGTGRIRIIDMFRGGLLLNIIAIFVISGVILVLN